MTTPAQPKSSAPGAAPMFVPHVRSAMPLPTPADMEAAYLHSRWLRGQVCTGEGRMLADLGYEVQRLREQADLLRRAEEALATALPYVCWCDNEGRQPEDYPEAADIVERDRKKVAAVLAELRMAREGK